MPDFVVTDAEDIVSRMEDHLGAYADDPGRAALVTLVGTMLVASQNSGPAEVDFILDVIEAYLVGVKVRRAISDEELAIARARQVLAPVLFDQDTLDD